jgi:hypothetical protein
MSKQWHDESPAEFADGFTEEVSIHHMKEGTLVASSNSGRYAIATEESEEGLDITSGQTLDVYLGDRWIAGSVEHASYLYAIESIGRPAQRGYYFQAKNGGRCGLVVGMRIRIP